MASRGLRVGLLGGSFDPAHAGHLHITHAALRRLRLDRVWWLISPGNPLKTRGPAEMPVRLARAERIVRDDPRIVVTDLERRLGTRFTAETLAGLTCAYPHVRFVWLMGADNLASFHLWDAWGDIMRRVPVGVLARPSHRLTALRSPAARRYAAARLPEALAPGLAIAKPPAWCFLNIPMRRDSSTELRASGHWRRPPAKA